MATISSMPSLSEYGQSLKTKPHDWALWCLGEGSSRIRTIDNMSLEVIQAPRLSHSSCFHERGVPSDTLRQKRLIVDTLWPSPSCLVAIDIIDDRQHFGSS